MAASQTTTQAPGSVSLTATIAGGAGPYTVQFKQGLTVVGTVFSPTNSISYTASGLAAGSYQFTAIVTDSVGNTVTTTEADATIAPSFAATLAAVQATTQAQGSVDLTTTIAGGVSPYTVQFKYGTTLVATVSGTGPTITTKVTNLNAGSYQFTAIVTDNATNTVIATAPAVTVASKLTAADLAAVQTTTQAPGNVIVTASVSGGVGPYTVQFTQNGKVVSTVTGSGPTLTYTATNLAAGSYQFTGIVTDSVGNTVTTTAPVVNVAGTISAILTTDVSQAFAPATVKVTATVSGSVGPYSVQFKYGSTVVTVLSPTNSISYTASGLAADFYSFTATVTDNAKNSVTTVPVTVTVTSSAPTISQVSPSTVAADDPTRIVFNGTMATPVNGGSDPSDPLTNVSTSGYVMPLTLVGTNFNQGNVTVQFSGGPFKATGITLGTASFGNPSKYVTVISETELQVDLPADYVHMDTNGYKDYTDCIKQAGKYTITVSNDLAKTKTASNTLVVTPVSSYGAGLQMFSTPFDYEPNQNGKTEPIGASVFTLTDANSLLFPITNVTPNIVDTFGLLGFVQADGTVGDTPGVAGKSILYTYNPSSNVYDYTGSKGNADSLRIGRGYWALFPDNQGNPGEQLIERGKTATQSGLLDPVDTGSFPILLQKGWNMIGDPSTATVLFSNMRVRLINTGQAENTIPEDTLAAGFQAGLVSASIYYYNSTLKAYSPQTTQLDPYVGYWIFAYQPCTLLVPVPVQ